MNQLVKLLTDDDGTPYENPKWCWVEHSWGGEASLCTGEYFGSGESACQYEVKRVIRGGITCEKCLEKIKAIKAIKL